MQVLHSTCAGIDCAQAAGRTKGPYVAAQYARFARRKGQKHAAVVVGHSLLEAAYFILRDQVPYQELGPHHWEELHKTQVRVIFRGVHHANRFGSGLLAERRAA